MLYGIEERRLCRRLEYLARVELRKRRWRRYDAEDEPVALEIDELMKPGSSFIIADRAPSRETGKGPDFIVRPC